MSDGVNDFEPPSSAVVSPGAILQQARLAQGLSLGDVAQALKLSQRQVESLEAGRWEQLPGPTVVRGFIRNYARLLRMDPNPLLEQVARAPHVLESLGNAQPTKEVMPGTAHHKRKDYLALAAGAGFVLLALGAYFLIPQDVVQSMKSAFSSLVKPASGKPDAANTGSIAEQSKRTEAQTVAIRPTLVGEKPAEDRRPEPALVREPETVVAPTAPVSPLLPQKQGEVKPRQLSFEFLGDAQLEVKNAVGEVVYSHVHPRRSKHSMLAEAGASLTVGNARKVRLAIDGAPIDLTEFSKANVARFNVQ